MNELNNEKLAKIKKSLEELIDKEQENSKKEEIKENKKPKQLLKANENIGS